MSPGKKGAIEKNQGGAARATYASIVASKAARAQPALPIKAAPALMPRQRTPRAFTAQAKSRFQTPVKPANRFAVLGEDADSDGVPASAPTNTPAAGAFAINARANCPTARAASSSASVLKGKMMACVDTGATSQHLFPPDWIIEEKKDDTSATVTWGDGSQARIVSSGYARIVLTDERGVEQNLRVFGWGINGLESPILSAIVFSEKGAALHAQWDKTYLDFRTLGGKLLHLRNDCLVEVSKAGSTGCAKASGESAPEARPDKQVKGGWRKGRKLRRRSPSQRQQGN
jgi:hypothetical protein